MTRCLSENNIVDVRIRLRDTAAELLVELGYAGFTMRKLAARLNISSMTPYRYFHNKEEILAAVRAYAFCRLADRLEAVLTADSVVTDQILPVVSAYIDFADQDQIYYRLMFDLPQETVETSGEVQPQELRVRTVITRHVRHLVEQHVFEGDPELIARILWSTLHGVVMLHLGGKLKDAEFDAVLAGTVQLLSRGFATTSQIWAVRRLSHSVSTAVE
jgi:AcrR family transcriptional regulator